MTVISQESRNYANRQTFKAAAVGLLGATVVAVVAKAVLHTDFLAAAALGLLAMAVVMGGTGIVMLEAQKSRYRQALAAKADQNNIG